MLGLAGMEGTGKGEGGRLSEAQPLKTLLNIGNRGKPQREQLE